MEIIQNLLAAWLQIGPQLSPFITFLVSVGFLVWFIRYKDNYWGANAIKGHLTMLLFGTIMALIDTLLFKRVADFSTLGVVAAFSVFPPLLIPARGICPYTERNQLWILTFSVSGVFGTFYGTLVGAWFVRSIMGYELQTSLFTFSTLTGIVVASIVCISYWTIGYMSRKETLEAFASFGHCPPETARLVMTLFTSGNLRHPSLGHELVVAIMDGDFNLILSGQKEERDRRGKVIQEFANPVWDDIQSHLQRVIKKKSQWVYWEETLKRSKGQMTNWINEFTTPVDIITKT